VVAFRDTDALQTISTVKIAQEASNPVSGLAWSPNSKRILVSRADQVRVYNVEDATLHAVVRNAGSGGGKPTFIHFGATDNEVVVFSAFGMKLSVFDLTSSKAVEIANPKFYHPLSAAKSYAFNSRSAHMAVLTRSAGRDALSIHEPHTREVTRSWFPETVDAAGLLWTPDGQWILIWESPAHGHRLLLHTPDGQLFRTLDSSRLCIDVDGSLQPGIRACLTSFDGRRCMVGDHSRSVTVLDTVNWRVAMTLNHPISVTPVETLQVCCVFHNTSPRAFSRLICTSALAGTDWQVAGRARDSRVCACDSDDIPGQYCLSGEEH
jgi:WD40 repeat protein